MIAGLDTATLAVGVLAVLIIGISKGGFAGGAGVVSTPLFAIMVGPVTAAAIMLPVLILMDAIGLWAYWRRWHWPTLQPVLLWGVAGVGLGWALFRFLDPRLLELMIGAMALAFFVYYAAQPWLRLTGRLAAKSAPWGILAGFTSFAIHAGGPPLGVHLLSLRLSKTQFQSATVAFFAAINLIKVPPYLQLGLFTADHLRASVLFAVVAPLGMGLGIWAHTRVAERWFFRVILALLLLAGLKLTSDGLTGG